MTGNEKEEFLDVALTAARAAVEVILHYYNDDFDIELSKVLALFIDGHSGVVGGLFPDGYLPFRIERIGDRYVAFWPDRRDFVDPSYPYLTKVDGMSLDEWRVVLQVMVPKGSPTSTGIVFSKGLTVTSRPLSISS